MGTETSTHEQQWDWNHGRTVSSKWEIPSRVRGLVGKDLGSLTNPEEKRRDDRDFV